MNVKAMGARVGCGWSDTVRWWLLVRCCAAEAVASCPVLLGGGFLPDAVRQWLTVALCHFPSNVARVQV